MTRVADSQRVVGPKLDALEQELSRMLAIPQAVVSAIAASVHRQLGVAG